MVPLFQPKASARLIVPTYPSADSVSLLSNESPYFPRDMPTHFEYWTMLSSMIQPRLQCVPTSPGCSAVGGAQLVAACRSVKPRTVM